MIVPGNLGFPSIVVVFLLIFGFVVHQKWRNALARKEEIMRLQLAASEEAAMAEFEAAVQYNSVPVAQLYQCAVCYCPTTTRCSRCKAVRYCSGKCQIMHWRQGHKDECRSSIATVKLNEGSNFGGASQKQFEVHGNDFEIEAKFCFSSEASSSMEDDDKVKPHGNAKGIHTAYPSSSTPSFSGFTASTARGDSLVDVSVSEVFGSGNPDRAEELISNGIAHDMLGTTSNVNNTELTISPPSESTGLVNSLNTIARPSKLNKMKSRYNDEVVHIRSEVPKAKTVISDDVQRKGLGNKKPTDGAVLSEKLVTDASKSRSSSFSSCSRSDSVANDRRNDSQFKCKEARSISASASGATGVHAGPSLKSAKNGNIHGVPVKDGGILSLPQSARSGLKTSVRKVVQQFKASKQLPNLLDPGSEIAGKDNYKILFPYELFKKLYSCDGVELFPFGLINCGNSCYANAVLQCLAFTRPLASYLLQGLHSKACQKKGWCFICEFECLILKAREGESPLSPIGILSRIQRIGSHLGRGTEEDAHEFFRYAVDTMQSVCLKEAGVVGQLAEETTLVGLTFGGYLRSKIKCMKCLGKSERYERMMDLTVEIDGDIRTLEEALAQFTASEILDGENKYQCSRCKSYEKAWKKLTVLEVPNVLTIVLKRFQSGNFGKLNKPVRFPLLLNMAPYMSGTSDKSPLYDLYAVVVHLDYMNAAFSGHYVCYVKNFQGEWFKIDDSTVTHVELESVLSEGAYILLYARHSPRVPGLLRNTVASHDGKLKRRNLEAVPSSLKTSKAKSNSVKPSADLSQQKLGKSPYRMNVDGPNSNQFFDPEDPRFHSMRRFRMADSSSESSSLFSCSDVGSCSTESTKDSASAEDFSDYIFGDVEPNWYSPYGLPVDSVSSSSLFFSRHAVSNPSFSQTFVYQNFNGDSALEADAVCRQQPNEGSCMREALEGKENSSLFYTDTTRHSRKFSSHLGSSSRRETDVKRSVLANLFDTKSGVRIRRSSRERSAQTFY